MRRRQIGQAIDAIGSEVVVFALFTVGDNGRTGRFEAGDGIANRLLVERIQGGVGAICLRKASTKGSGRGMLPMGSVGIIMGRREFEKSPS